MTKKQLEEPIYGKGEKIKEYYNKVKSELIYAFDTLLIVIPRGLPRGQAKESY